MNWTKPIVSKAAAAVLPACLMERLSVHARFWNPSAAVVEVLECAASSPEAQNKVPSCSKFAQRGPTAVNCHEQHEPCRLRDERGTQPPSGCPSGSVQFVTSVQCFMFVPRSGKAATAASHWF
jgi:hypothetical protein